MSDPEKFDARKYLTQLSGKDYLEVKWRLLWLRTEHPDAAIETEMKREDGASAVFKATVTIPGRGSATGWGSESYQDFGDYIEKAETKSLGRALAALGFGTQFSYDHEDGPPPERPRPPRPTADELSGRQPASPPMRRGPNGPGSDAASEKQLEFLYDVGRRGHMSRDEVDAFIASTYSGRRASGLSKREASQAIDLLKQQTGG